MSKNKEMIKEILKEGEPILSEKVAQRVEDELPLVVKQIKEGIEDRIEAETIGIEFLKQLQPIIESRRELKEAEQAVSASISSLKMVIEDLIQKFDSFSELKTVNLNLEREVLTDIKTRLHTQE
jgi:hypothetical protein